MGFAPCAGLPEMAAVVVARKIEERVAKEGGDRSVERVLSAVICIRSI